MKISAGTKVHNLLKQHPFSEDFLAAYNPKFEMLMWGLHDQIRASLKEIRAAAEGGDGETFAAKTPAFARDLVEMVYKEEKILFPMSLETLSEEEWTELRKGEDELGYGLATPATD